MKKYYVVFAMDGGNDIFTIHTIIESNRDLNTTTSEIINAVHSGEFFTADRDPKYYQDRNLGRVAIRTSKVVDMVVREA